jgi:hypothetical protein
VYTAAEFGVKIMWGKIKKLKEVVCVLKIKKIFFKRDRKLGKILNFRWVIVPNSPAIILPLSVERFKVKKS